MRNLVIDKLRQLIIENYICMDSLDKLDQMSNQELLDILEEMLFDGWRED